MTEWRDYQRDSEYSRSGLLNLLSRVECQKWRNITSKIGVTSAGFYVGLVLGGASLARA
jgi:hypothetical protein